MKVIFTLAGALMVAWTLQQTAVLGQSATLSNTATNAPALPPLNEVLQLLRTQLKGLSAEEIERAAVKGLLLQLEQQVSLVGAPPSTSNALPSTNAINRALVLDEAYGYIRFSQIRAGAGEEFGKTWQQLSSTNKLKGLVLDLRFAGGTDYAAAAAVADYFLSSAEPLLDWGGQVVKGSGRTNAIEMPVMILVNAQTAAAAEAVAGILRGNRVGLLLGGFTAGQMFVFKEFPLSTGQRLQIASGPVVLGQKSEGLTRGLKPDIEIVPGLETEKAFYADAYKAVTKVPAASRATEPGSTNAAPRKRLNEAELVRLQREGTNLEQELAARPLKELELGRPVVNDPVLARALDLLKGLAVVHQNRSH